MNKEDILALSRAEQNDEGMRDGEEQGSQSYGAVVDRLVVWYGPQAGT